MENNNNNNNNNNSSNSLVFRWPQTKITDLFIVGDLLLLNRNLNWFSGTEESDLRAFEEDFAKRRAVLETLIIN